MTVLNTGSTKKYSANWGDIFGGAAGKKKSATAAKPAAAKKPAKKAAPKKKAAKKK